MRPSLLAALLFSLLYVQNLHGQVLPNQSYGPHQRNRMDVYLPQQHDTATPTIVLIHGGAWIIGHKKQWLPEIIQALTTQGYAVACINYRYACRNYLAQMHDVDLAIKHLQAQAPAHQLSSSRVALAGVSAGGHLSLLYAHAFDTAHTVKAVVSMCGPTNLTDSLFYRYLKHYCIGFVLKRFLGEPFKKQTEVYRQASPLYRLSRVPSLFIHGQIDDLVPTSQSVRMFQAMQAAGYATDTLLLPHTGHLITGKHKANVPLIIQSLLSWFKKYL